MDEEDSEVRWVEIRNGGIEASGKTPGKSHEEVAADSNCQNEVIGKAVRRDAQVVRMLAEAPPSRNQELGASLGVHGLQI